MTILDGAKIESLVRLVEESTRSTKEGVKFFIEPAPGTLSRAKNRRHHIIFGRRGSGKSSLLAKLTSDLTLDRTPIAYIDLEEFKSHSYPDVLLSVLIKTLREFSLWFGSAAVNSSTKSSFWHKLFGASPKKAALSKTDSASIASELESMIQELERALFSSDETKFTTIKKTETSEEIQTALNSGAKIPVVQVDAKTGSQDKNSDSSSTQSEYSSKKVEILHRNIMRYKALFNKITSVSDGPAYLLLDDLYHIRISDQAEVLDYFHRIAKGTNLWLKVGTIRHRSRWYVYANPPRGMKLGDDADEIDLDVTLEKYDLTKRFLLKILDQFARSNDTKLEEFLSDGARDRLVLASGGVARDFLTIFRRAVDVARERLARGDEFRGFRVGAEDVNKAAGEYDKFKREDLVRDTGTEDQTNLLDTLKQVNNFCLSKTESNCFLIDKDLDDEETKKISELVDLKFLHHVRSRVTVRDRVSRIYDAYMLDLSQYTGERTRRNFEIVEFWTKGADDTLRKTKLIYRETTASAKG